MSLRVTVVDEQTGDTDTAVVADGDYLLICTVRTCVLLPCIAAWNRWHGSIKGRTAR